MKITFLLAVLLLAGPPPQTPPANAAEVVTVWTNRYNGPRTTADNARAVAVDSNGNVFVTGSSVAMNGLSDYATVAYSGAGVPLWTNRFNGPRTAWMKPTR